MAGTWPLRWPLPWAEVLPRPVGEGLGSDLGLGEAPLLLPWRPQTPHPHPPPPFPISLLQKLSLPLPHPPSPETPDEDSPFP